MAYSLIPKRTLSPDRRAEVAEFLRKSAAFVRVPGRWTRGSYKRPIGNQQPMYGSQADDPELFQFCAVGAMRQIRNEVQGGWSNFHLASAALRRSLNMRNRAVATGIEGFNDNIAKDANDVANEMEAAAQLLEKGKILL